MAEKKSMMSLAPCCDEVASCWLVLAIGASDDVRTEDLLRDVEEANHRTLLVLGAVDGWNTLAK